MTAAYPVIRPRNRTAIEPFGTGPAQTIDLTPQIVNLLLYQSDTVRLDLICTDEGGTPSDLTGAVALSQIKASFDSPDIMAEFTPTITDNVITLLLPHTEAQQLVVGRAVWDAQITVDDEVTTLVAGTVTVAPEVSW